MRQLILNSGLIAQVDDEDFEKVNKFNWSARKDGNTFYATSGGNYKGVNTRKTLHRFILNPSSEQFIDHKDGDGLNCQKSNLRICTNQQNQFNQKKRKGTSSIYKGVRARKNCKTYEVTIRENKEKKYIGSFKNEKEAALAYNKKALELFGEFARINTI
jgi:hypothetical protein